MMSSAWTDERRDDCRTAARFRSPQHVRVRTRHGIPLAPSDVHGAARRATPSRGDLGEGGKQSHRGLVERACGPPGRAALHDDAREVRAVHSVRHGSAGAGSFRATFFRGHLERGGEPIPELSDVNVRITDIVYARRFDQRGRPDDLTYLLLGRGGELFLAHVISEPPDFDQILSVELAGPHPDDEELQAGIQVVFEGRANTAEARLRSAETATARGHVTGAHQFITLEFGEVRELYFEEGELSTSRGAFEPTPLETEAGFGD